MEVLQSRVPEKAFPSHLPKGMTTTQGIAVRLRVLVTKIGWLPFCSKHQLPLKLSTTEYTRARLGKQAKSGKGARKDLGSKFRDDRKGAESSPAPRLPLLIRAVELHVLLVVVVVIEFATYVPYLALNHPNFDFLHHLVRPRHQVNQSPDVRNSGSILKSVQPEGAESLRRCMSN
ncbi:hypothetical protein MPTK1_3g06520 [Marchantia polymorpha subsp. ruderalis]|uniref:Uncharacterized protein n=2 Tax=Marchantia polymorpha TaxID=3197 RepID=A0A176W583_MARPO|nr:hypothetical protein AXG93_2515s1260 [Marchantia polymorpha subsp. ruderalis]PTQ48090.1 hypothetical protein MARPO_0006s0121 [Marchantia polymorpha]BBN04655.1 hypothetical protein Mp_3g06520 [Marchantia polymorpha subsp. ruderalis]|eukprot:PTQ48090.1 hypothetical protein MARPO_0006s0121 [Marchantia polymorpha]